MFTTLIVSLWFYSVRYTEYVSINKEPPIAYSEYAGANSKAFDSKQACEEARKTFNEDNKTYFIGGYIPNALDDCFTLKFIEEK